MGKSHEKDTMQAELKVSLIGEQLSKALMNLRLDMVKALARNVYFLDTQGFGLSEAGLILRARKTADNPDDATVKLRPMTRGDVNPKWGRLAGFKDEVDIVGARRVQSCSLSDEPKRGRIDHVVIGADPIETLFSEVQLTFIKEYAKVPVDWSQIRAYGPIQARIWGIKVKDLASVKAELWRLPNGTRLLEISVKGPLGRADDIQRRLDAFLAEHSLQGVADGDTKTFTAVRFFKGDKT